MRRIFVIGFIVMSIAGSAAAFDHQYANYDAVLKTYVRNGLVNYSKLQKERRVIDEFVNELQQVPPEDYGKWNRSQQLAFWINAYNGWFIQIVINHYPIQKQIVKSLIYPDNSVQHIPGIWKDIKAKFAGREVSLDIIEHKILRPEFREPRIHFAIVCASIGCPQLRSEAFRSAELESQLNDAARSFVNDPAKVRLLPSEKQIRISKIFDWFSGDFSSFSSEDLKRKYSAKESGPLGFISKYVKQSDAKAIANGVEVQYFDYDWTLNEQKLDSSGK